MQRRFWLALLFVMTLIAPGAGAVSADSTPYTDPLGRFTFTPPDGLTLDRKASTGGTAIFSNSDQKTSIRIFVLQGSDLSLDDRINQYIADGKTRSSVTFINDQPQTTTLDGQSARQAEYFNTDNSGRFHWLVTYAYNGNVVAHLDAYAPDTAWDAFQPQMTAALSGFHFQTATYPMRYTDPQGRFNFALPFGWQRDISLSAANGTEDGFIGFNPPGTIYAGMMPIPNGVTLDQYAAAAITNDTKNDATIQTDQTTAAPTTLGGQPAFQWEYFNTANNTRFHHRLIWAYSGGNRYRVSINVRDDRWNDFLPQAMTLINSFAFGTNPLPS